MVKHSAAEYRGEVARLTAIRDQFVRVQAQKRASDSPSDRRDAAKYDLYITSYNAAIAKHQGYADEAAQQEATNE